jgi:hypothetical protein
VVWSQLLNLISDSDFENRIACTQEYLQCLADFYGQRRQWEDDYRRIDEESLAVRFVLLHPFHYDEDNTDKKRCEIRGGRRFPFKPQVAEGGCAAKLLWGYSCPLEGTNLQVDHEFPYSLGGPTDPRNRLILCDMHNRLKSSDLHVYPWEKGEPKWLRDILDKIARKRDTDRRFGKLV